jgi:hypothetical protein
MSKDHVLQLRYLGVIPQIGFVEYGFRIENKDKSVQQVILTIADDLFKKNDLKLQEAPDLCYQMVLMGLEVEKADSRLSFSIPVTALDIAHYRDLHPNTKLRKHLHRDNDWRRNHDTDIHPPPTFPARFPRSEQN